MCVHDQYLAPERNLRRLLPVGALPVLDRAPLAGEALTDVAVGSTACWWLGRPGPALDVRGLGPPPRRCSAERTSELARARVSHEAGHHERDDAVARAVGGPPLRVPELDVRPPRCVEQDGGGLFSDRRPAGRRPLRPCRPPAGQERRPAAGPAGRGSARGVVAFPAAAGRRHDRRPASMLPGAVALGALAGTAVAFAHGDLRLAPAATARTAAVVAALALALGAASAQDPAWAHDPGQGKQVRKARGPSLAPAAPRASRWTWTGRASACVQQARSRVAPAWFCGARSASRTRVTVAASCTARSKAGRRPVVRLRGSPRRGCRGRSVAARRAGSHRDAAAPAVRPIHGPDAGTRNAAGSALLVVCAALLVACLRLARRSGGQLPSAAVA